MRVKGIGTIKKSEAMSILTEEGKKAVRDGEITAEELGDMYKFEMVKRASKIGAAGDTFRKSYGWIPEELKTELSPAQVAPLAGAWIEISCVAPAIVKDLCRSPCGSVD